MFANQVVNPTPPPPAPNPPAVWLAGVWQDASEKNQAGVQLAVTAMNGPLWATLPSGSADKNGSTTGYLALMGAIITEAGKQKPPQVYEPLYTTWPTNAPPVAAGSTHAWLSAPVTANCVIGFGYDWRQDNLTVTAKMLQNFLYDLTTTPGNTVDKITLIGHSMGGLVSRAYLESVALSPDTKTAQDATILGMIDQLITLGTPHLGAPMALGPIAKTLELVKGLDGEIFVWLLSEIFSTVPSPETVANLTTIIDDVVNSPGVPATNPGPGVSTYQLLPNYAFINAGGKNELPIYPYDTSNLPQGLITLLNAAGLQQSDLNATIGFFNALSYTTNPNPKIAYQCIYGVVDLTHLSPAPDLKLLTQTTTGYTYNGSKLAPVRPIGGGDLVVPWTSASFTGNPSIPDAQRIKVWGADHITMPSNPNIWSVVNGLINFAS
ncbi:MAG: lipase family alpha/beta hydrolase [Reyranellales bacterium]